MKRKAHKIVGISHNVSSANTERFTTTFYRQCHAAKWFNARFQIGAVFCQKLQLVGLPKSACLRIVLKLEHGPELRKGRERKREQLVNECTWEEKVCVRDCVRACVHACVSE